MLLFASPFGHPPMLSHRASKLAESVQQVVLRRLPIVVASHEEVNLILLLQLTCDSCSSPPVASCTGCPGSRREPGQPTFARAWAKVG